MWLLCLQHQMCPLIVTVWRLCFTRPTRSSVCVTRARAWRAMRLCRPSPAAQSRRRTSAASRLLPKRNCSVLGQQTVPLPLPSWQWTSAATPPITSTVIVMPCRWSPTTASRRLCAALHVRASRWTVFELAYLQTLPRLAARCHWCIGHLTARGIKAALSLLLMDTAVNCEQIVGYSIHSLCFIAIECNPTCKVCRMVIAHIVTILVY